MPRSLTRPETGQIVWYYAASPPTVGPLAALVTATVDRTHFNLAVFAADASAMTAALNVPFHYGTRPVSGAWCTMMRVNENAPGAWPSQQEASEVGLALELHGLNEEQREAYFEQRQEIGKKRIEEIEQQIESGIVLADPERQRLREMGYATPPPEEEDKEEEEREAEDEDTSGEMRATPTRPRTGGRHPNRTTHR